MAYSCTLAEPNNKSVLEYVMPAAEGALMAEVAAQLIPLEARDT